MISVIVPAYNVSKYIISCLDSLEKQTYKAFEVIIVDDGSTDNTIKKINMFMQNSNMTLKIIKQENKGVSVARNMGIKHCRGEYVCFLDSDDMLSPYYLAYLLLAINHTNSETAICQFTYISEEDMSVNDTSPRKLQYECFDSLNLLYKMLYHKISAGIWVLLIKRELLNNLYFAEGFKYSEDLEMVWRIVAKSSKVVVLKNPLYNYRIRQGSAMSVINRHRIDGYKLMVKLEKYFYYTKPKFYESFKKYGVARWVWATLWQEAVASQSYSIFIDSVKYYECRKRMGMLLTYPQLKVQLTTLLFIIHPLFYYYFIKIYYKGSRKFSRKS